MKNNSFDRELYRIFSYGEVLETIANEQVAEDNIKIDTGAK